MPDKTSPVIAVVIPCYNEEDLVEDSAVVLSLLIDEMADKGKVSPESFVYVVDDGSDDRTWSILEGLHKKNRLIKALKLSTNVGHQNAMLAGMMESAESADCIVTLDADLQDDVGVIAEMLEKYRSGYEIVYGVRKNRKTDGLFKKASARVFYMFQRLMGMNIIPDHADFRLVSKRVAKELENFREVNLFLRGIFPLMGFNHTTVYYERKQRKKGKTKFGIRKMVSFALDGITSFSVMPLRIVTLIGFACFFVSIIMSIWSVITFLSGKTIPGWASTIFSLYFIGGTQIIGIGLLGEYVGKIYREVKNRPRYIKEKELI